MTSQLREIIECLIFVSLEPLSLEKIKGVLQEYADEDIKSAVDDILTSYASNERGIQIIQAAGGLLFTTKPQHDEWIRRLYKDDRRNKLSPASLEVLSIVAYHQPVTLAEISAIRGVDSSHSLKTLLLKRLVKITGRKKAPGKPLIYRTTGKFLAYFGLNDINELPSLEEIEKILDEENPDEEA
jgi:segregation and condensation protein B